MKIRTLVPNLLLASTFLTGFGPVGLAGAFSISEVPGKLPRIVLPTHYTIDLKPDLTTLAINGSETIDINVLQETNRLTLNALKITISSASLDDEQRKPASVSFDEKAQTVTLAFLDSILSGRHQLRISFTSRINQFSQGMFYVDYPASSGSKRMLATQLEPTDARRIFPCWDEPAFKASFEPAVTVPASSFAVSNMPITHEERLTDASKRVSFGPTPPMSSYLFVMVAGDLARLNDHVGNVEVGIVTQAGKQQQGRYALDNALKLLSYYDNYFGAKYPLPKLDLIAVPGGFGGAMENWGGITFHEGSLLYDPASSPRALQHRIFYITAHEMAHQWFGDLVTTAWWNDLWLNEGFADWMQAKVEDQFHPEWKVWLNESRKQGAMYEDARTMSHPIQQTITDESEAAIAFDQITYAKGAAIVRVIENYLGEDAFRDGIRRYISDHAYSNATTGDLWTALERASGKPVAPIARSYTEQPGLPLIVVNERCANGQRSLALMQERFAIYDPGAKPEIWQVPLNWGVAGDHKARGATLLRDRSANIDAGPCGPPIKLNIGDVGYYRVQYDPTTLAALTRAIETMQPEDRANLLADSWALLESGRTGAEDYLRLVEGVTNDNTRAVWRQLISTFQRIDHLEQGLPQRPAFQAYARSILRPAFERLGWDAVAGEPEDKAILRSALIAALGDLNDLEIAREAKRRFALFLQRPASLDVNLRDAVIGVVGRDADQQTYDALRKLGRDTRNLRDRMSYYTAMARAQNPSLIEQTLRLSLTEELPPERATELILVVAMGDHPELALKFVYQNFDALAAKRSPEFRYFFMSNVMENFAQRSYADDLAKFAPAQETPGGRIEALRAEARIRESADFREHQLVEINSWVKRTGKVQPARRGSRLFGLGVCRPGVS